MEIDLADGNRASVGDLIITRRNDRRLTTGRDWVRNGDRWTITALDPDGGIHAIHRRTGKSVTLPAGYVREAVELGYATTIHTAQGVTADTTHGLVDELMTREQLYTMVSRGRTANHLYRRSAATATPTASSRPIPRSPPHRRAGAGPVPQQPRRLSDHRPPAGTDHGRGTAASPGARPHT